MIEENEIDKLYHIINICQEISNDLINNKWINFDKLTNKKTNEYDIKILTENAKIIANHGKAENNITINNSNQEYYIEVQLKELINGYIINIVEYLPNDKAVVKNIDVFKTIINNCVYNFNLMRFLEQQISVIIDNKHRNLIKIR